MIPTKAILIGDVQVGKSYLAERLLKRDNLMESVTVAAAWHEIDFRHNGEKHLIRLVDTAGQERFRALVPRYFRDADIVVMVFDQTKRSSFENLTREWSDLLAQNAPPGIIKFIVQNKIDLDNCEMTEDEIRDTVNRISAEEFFFRTSALNNVGVDELRNALQEAACRTTPVDPSQYDAPEPAEPGCNC